jgi:hypothetical protein
MWMRVIASMSITPMSNARNTTDTGNTTHPLTPLLDTPPGS